MAEAHDTPDLEPPLAPGARRRATIWIGLDGRIPLRQGNRVVGYATLDDVGGIQVEPAVVEASEAPDLAAAREIVLAQLTRTIERRLHRGDLVDLAASPELSRAAQAAAAAVLDLAVLLPPGWSLEWLQDPQARLDEETTRIPVTQAEPGVGYAVDRDALGRLVRDEWMAWAREQHPELQERSWPVPWEQLSEAEREVDRRIGERLYLASRAAVRAERGRSYHDLHITTDEIPRTSIFDLPHNIEVTCNRVGGWEVWDSSQNAGRDNWRLLGGEYNAEPEDNEEGRPVRGGLRLDVAGFVIVDSLGKEAGGD